MARAETNKLYRDFTKGLITEASYLTYPEDASIDESNTVISRKGNRTRRTGIEYEDNYVLENLGITDDKNISELIWTSANNNPLYNFIVIQVGSVVYFYRLDQGVISSNKQTFTIDLAEYTVPGRNSTDVENEFAGFSEGAGFLFIAHRFCDPISVAYDDVEHTISAIRVVIQIRDFDGLYDGLANDQEPSTLSPEHHYNLLNQGWMTPGTGGVASAGVRTSVGPGGVGNVIGSNQGFSNSFNTIYLNPFTGNAESYIPNLELPPYFDQSGREN